MARPERRRSNLIGSSPVLPPVPTPTQPPTDAPTSEDRPPEVVGAAPKASTPRKRAQKRPKSTPSKSSGKPPTITFYVRDEETAKRIRAAFVHTHAREGQASFSQFVEATLLDRVKRLEREHNDGEPFPTSVSVARGRPITL